jgi:hypothetical protein
MARPGMTAAQELIARALIPSQFSSSARDPEKQPSGFDPMGGCRFSDKITRHNGFAGVQT